MTDPTLSFYDDNAASYAADEDPPNPNLAPFLARCPPGGRILELGTGGGVDAEAILRAGFDLDATDGSAALAAIATARIGRPVRTMLFEELEAIAQYDGIYACASLTHAARAALPDVVTRIHRALVPGGLVWASFKTGQAEGADALGRHYNYLGRAELLSIWQDAARWSSVEIAQWSGGGFDRRPTEWLGITARR